MTEGAQDVDTAKMDEELARSQELIDEAKESAEELAKTNPDPYETDAEAREDTPADAVPES